MITWITTAAVVAIHDEQLAEHGGADGIIDLGLLESALDRPKNLVAYSMTTDIAALTAAYAFGIVKNHAFVDGNKRTSSVVSRSFLLLNGYDVTADRTTRLDVWLRLSDGTLSENDFAEWLRSNIEATTP